MLTDANGCTASSSTLSIINAAINDYTSFGDIITYPNPTSGKFYFKGYNNSSLPVKVEVQNNFGQTVFSETDFRMNDAIDLSNKAQGMYFIQIKDGLKVQSFKVLKQ
jgi:hypothetical protein